MTGYNVTAKFNGLEVEDERVKIEIRRSELATTKCYNDIMLEEGKQLQKLMIGDTNIYDIVGIDSATINQAFNLKLQQEQMERQKQEQMQMAQMQQAQAQQGQAEQQQQQQSPEDQQLINQYGAPEE